MNHNKFSYLAQPIGSPWIYNDAKNSWKFMWSSIEDP
jgi:hypothetical protein